MTRAALDIAKHGLNQPNHIPTPDQLEWFRENEHRIGHPVRQKVADNGFAALSSVHQAIRQSLRDCLCRQSRLRSTTLS